MVKWPRGATAFGARGQHAVDFPDGSEARHISTAQYYKELIEQQGSLQENIGNLLQLEEEAQKKLKQVKGEINTQKMKSAAVNATTTLSTILCKCKRDSVISSLISGFCFQK